MSNSAEASVVTTNSTPPFRRYLADFHSVKCSSRLVARGFCRGDTGGEGSVAGENTVGKRQNAANKA